jgi:AAA+ ATPase superfamily predicted ATPase
MITMKTANNVASLLKVIGITTIVIGVIAGLIFGDVYAIERTVGFRVERSYNFSIMFITWLSAFITGVVFIGFSEIVKLLHKIAINTSPVSEVINGINPDTETGANEKETDESQHVSEDNPVNIE